MILDRGQKSQALKVVVGKRWFPQLEVDVLPKVSTTDSQKPLTDVDVLALVPDEFEGFRALLIDCKTRKKESPITRALWLRGLMEHLSATRGLCIFAKEKIEPDHRYSAGQLGVLLLTQEEFDNYGQAIGSRQDATLSNCADIERWERYFEIGSQFAAIAPTVEFSTAAYWMCRSESEACRRVIAEAVRVRPELDPEKKEHIAIVFDLAALFAHSLSRIVSRVFASYLQPKSRDELSAALLTFIYGGKENYDHLNSLKRMITGPSNGERPLTLPEWDRFLQLVRHCLDAPVELSNSPLILREVGWSYLGNQRLEFASVLASEKRQAAKLALLAAEYIIKASKYPPEFNAVVSNQLLSIQQVPTQITIG